MTSASATYATVVDFEVFRAELDAALSWDREPLAIELQAL